VDDLHLPRKQKHWRAGAVNGREKKKPASGTSVGGFYR
jgi:hypothetical protein